MRADSLRRKASLVVVTLLVQAILIVAGSAGAQEAGTSLASEYPAPSIPPPLLSAELGAILTTNARGWKHLIQTSDARGALVLAALPGSPAREAGLAPGDVIVAVDDLVVTNETRARFLLRTRENLNISVSLVGPTGEARTVATQLGKLRVNEGRYLTTRLAQAPDQVTRYLFARSLAKPEEALSLLSLVGRTAHEFPQGRVLRARALIATRPAEPPALRSAYELSATEEIENGLAFGPDSPETMVLAAQAYLGLNRPNDAEEVAARAVGIDPDDAAAQFVLGGIRLAAGKPEAGLPHLHRAVQLDPYQPENYHALAEAYEALGLHESARSTRDVLTAITARPEESRDLGKAVKVALTLAATIVILSIGLATLTRRDRKSALMPSPRLTLRPSVRGLLEGLGAVGLWGVVIPFIGPDFGLIPQDRRDVEVLEHLVPGSVILVAVVVALVRVSRTSELNENYYLAPMSTVLAGLWMTTTHVSLAFDAISGTTSWGLAIFLSTSGPTVLVLSLLLYRSIGRALPDREPKAVDEARPASLSAGAPS